MEWNRKPRNKLLPHTINYYLTSETRMLNEERILCSLSFSNHYSSASVITCPCREIKNIPDCGPSNRLFTNDQIMGNTRMISSCLCPGAGSIFRPVLEDWAKISLLPILPTYMEFKCSLFRHAFFPPEISMNLIPSLQGKPDNLS